MVAGLVGGEVGVFGGHPFIPERERPVAVAFEPAGQAQLARGFDPDRQREPSADRGACARHAFEDDDAVGYDVVPFGEFASLPIIALIPSGGALSERE